MKKELALHYLVTFVFFLLVVVVNKWFSLGYWPLLIGAAIGTMLPDIDHFIYIYFLRPQELNSQRVMYLVKERNFNKTLDLLSDTRYERTKIIFHTIYFQIIFLLLTFLILNSSGSLFGMGMVLSFYLHLLIDQAMDFIVLGNINTWFVNLPFKLTRDQSILYWAILFVILLVFGIRLR